jgi:hypothetical protein
MFMKPPWLFRSVEKHPSWMPMNGLTRVPLFETGPHDVTLMKPKPASLRRAWERLRRIRPALGQLP